MLCILENFANNTAMQYKDFRQHNITGIPCSVESDDREVGVAFCREFFWNQNSAYFHKIKALKYIGEPPVWENMHNHNEETDSTVSYTIYIYSIGRFCCIMGFRSLL